MAKIEFATLAGGCFWCLDAVFREMDGVISSVSGYMGGQVDKPSYRDVCAGTTGHAEVVNITFNPQIVTFRDLLEVFFTIHDPTTKDRQGNDVGSQYRSAIFYHSDEQCRTANAIIAELSADNLYYFKGTFETEVVPDVAFWPADDYHQNYFEENPAQTYCLFVVAGKVKKFRDKFAPKRRRSEAA